MENKPRINFIQRNRQNIGQRRSAKPSSSSSPSDRPSSAPTAPTEDKKDVKTQSGKYGLKKSSAELRPAGGVRLNKRNRPIVDDVDIITKMIRRNLHQQLLQIFLPMDSTTLTACREVCKSWSRYFRLVFWREVRVRTELERRLAENWRTKRYYKVEMEIVSGVGCKMKCRDNFRDCHCGDRLECLVEGDRLVLQFGGSSLAARYSATDNTASAAPQQSEWRLDEKFEVEQFQLRFSLKAGLELEMKNWLSSPVFLKDIEQNSVKASDDSFIVEKHPGDATMILIRDRKTREVLAKVKPYTGLVGDHYSEILGLKCCNKRLAINIGGCISVFNLELLARGNNGGALLLVANQQDRDKENVHYFYISDNFLLTVSNSTITLYDFWKYKIVSRVKDFIL